MISIASIDQTGSASIGVPTLMEEAQRERVRRIHADYCGWQDGANEGEGFHLYTLLQTLSPKLVKGSTITQATLDGAIFK